MGMASDLPPRPVRRRNPATCTGEPRANPNTTSSRGQNERVDLTTAQSTDTDTDKQHAHPTTLARTSLIEPGSFLGRRVHVQMSSKPGQVQFRTTFLGFVNGVLERSPDKRD